MKNIHINTRKDKNTKKFISETRKRIYNDYICDLNDGNLDIENERLYINSLKDQYNNSIFTGVIASIIGVLAGIILPPLFELFSKATNSFQISFSYLIALIITFIIILIFLFLVFIFYYFIILKDIFKIYKKYLKRITYYSICLEVLDEIENKIKEKEKV